MVWRGDGINRVAACLLTLFDQVDAHYPGRDTSSDGTLGNAAHQATKSDHNPDEHGVVRALDITHDPAHGFNSYQFADYLREHWDDRIQYIISNGRIANIDVGAKAWRAYNGQNPHAHHVHISARGDDRADDARPFSIIPFFDGSAVPPPKEGNVLVKFGDHGPAVGAVQQLLGIDVDGYFGTRTDAAVRAYQASHGLEVDGEVGNLTWTALTTNAPPVVPPVVQPPSGAQTSKGSWYSQFDGRYRWRDPGDRPDSAALGVPDDAQGIARPQSLGTLGTWFWVLAPNGRKSLEIQSDHGPAAWTGRTLDISAAAAERFGYSPDNFPTDGIFTFWPVAAPAEVASLSPAQQAIRYRDLRNTLPPPPIVIPPPPLPDPEGNTMDDKIKLVLITEICKPAPDVKALQLLLLNQPVIPGVPPPVVPPGVAPSTTGQNLLYGLGGSLISLLLGMNGNIGLPFGPDFSSTGLLSTVIPMITGLFGWNVPAVNAVTNLIKPKS